MSESNATSLISIDRTHGDLVNTKTMRHRLAQQVVRISVPFPQLVPADGPQGVAIDCDITALRVAELGPQRTSREPRKRVVARPARKRHVPLGPRPCEAVPLHEIGLIFDERAEDAPQACGRHLSVACHDDSQVGPARGCALASGCNGGADAAIGLMRH